MSGVREKLTFPPYLAAIPWLVTPDIAVSVPVPGPRLTHGRPCQYPGGKSEKQESAASDRLQGPLDKKLKYDPQVIKWAQRLMGDSGARPDHLNQEQLAWIGLELQKRRHFTPARATST